MGRLYNKGEKTMKRYELLEKLDELNMYVYDAVFTSLENEEKDFDIVDLSEEILKRYRKKFMEIWNDIYDLEK